MVGLSPLPSRYLVVVKFFETLQALRWELPEPENRCMDINTLAKSIVDQATGDKPKKKIQPATAKRGHARADALTPEKRKAIAQKAAQTRWKTTQSLTKGDSQVS